ncbi:MAG: hypothetical protein PHW04_15485 [Candidatus Wallbacteria bacterium]|nr:hypothetical protein [Candidatus Wallbacteria bacterium]
MKQSIAIPREALLSILRSLPERALVDLFWETMVETDESPLSDDERNLISKGKKEHRN